MEFSKKIILWAMRFTSMMTALITVLYYATGRMPEEIVALLGTVMTGVVISYAAKAGAENVQKIKKGEKQE